jgi:hypothetical protein
VMDFILRIPIRPQPITANLNLSVIVYPPSPNIIASGSETQKQ